VILQSFDPRTLRVMKKLDATVRRAALFEQPADWLEIAREFEATICGPEFHLVTPERVAQAHAARLQVTPWTVNDPSDWARLADARVDGIISDDPAALIAWLNERGLH
jgi:glycerophosphoryl diester phosphodiesterase